MNLILKVQNLHCRVKNWIENGISTLQRAAEPFHRFPTQQIDPRTIFFTSKSSPHHSKHITQHNMLLMFYVSPMILCFYKAKERTEHRWKKQSSEKITERKFTSVPLWHSLNMNRYRREKSMDILNEKTLSYLFIQLYR